jgi:hypothetical protein
MPGFTAYQYQVIEGTVISPLNGPFVSYRIQRNLKPISRFRFKQLILIFHQHHLFIL